MTSGKLAIMRPDDPSTIAHASSLRRKAARWDVHVMSGVDQGASVAVSPRSAGRVLVGTSEACHLRLTDRSTSRRHLALEAIDEGVRVVDLGSTNGTRINGLRVGDATCTGGELVTIGDTTLRVDPGEVEIEAPDVRMAFGPLVGASLAMRRLYRTCDALAASRTPLVIEGEEGTGKTLLAEALHLASEQRDDAFVVVDAASPETSWLGECAGGTLVLRHVDESPLEAQLVLVDLVATAASRDVRIVATTRKDLDAAVERGLFLEELLRELSARIELPPLRTRRGDIGLLVERFCRDLGTTSEAIPPKQLAMLNRREYPANVRELQAAVANLLAGAPLARPQKSAPLDIEVSYRDILEARRPFAEAKQELLDRFATAYVTHAVACHGGHVARAAAASGLAPRYFNILRARGRSRDPGA